jgi:hypothetical protein
MYTPAYLGETTVTNSIRWDAVREGIEDYEELAMLQDAINKSNNAAWKNRAQQTLDTAVKAITGMWNPVKHAVEGDDVGLADRQLQQVRDLLKSGG